MDVRNLTVEVRDRNLVRVGQILESDLNLTFTDLYNNVGSWSLVIRPDHPLTDSLRQPGAGLVVTRSDGTVLMSGPTVQAVSESTAGNPGGLVTITGVTDDVILADYLAWPEPSNSDVSTQAAVEDVRTGNAESLLHAYVNANVGPSAPSARRNAHLQMGTDGGRGSTQTQRAKFDVLGTLLNTIATPASLGFRIIQVGTHLEFQTYAVQDRSLAVRLDVANNMLASHRTALAPPGVTRVIVGGQGEGDNRTYLQMDTTDSVDAEGDWGRRIEQFVDSRGTDDPTELQQAGTAVLVDEGFSAVSVQAVPMEDFGPTFGTDWFLGDKVATVVDGVELAAIVTGMVLKADKDGFRIGVLIGDPFGFDGTPAQQVAKIDTRVSSLERGVEITRNVGPRLTAVEATLATGNVGLTGEIRMWGGDTAPSGWHLADGTSLSTTTNAALFAVYGYKYGGSGSSFNLPNMKGRIPVGLDTGQTEFNTVGKTGGEKAHVLTQTEMPAHTHTGPSHSHGAGSLTTSTAGAHQHTIGAQNVSPGGSPYGMPANAGSAGDAGTHNIGTFASGDHSHPVTGTTAAAGTGNTGSAGSDGAHNNLQPYITINYIIKL